MRRNTVVLFLLALVSVVSAQTGYIRQFARDKPKVVFIAVGSQSKMHGYRLRDKVLEHPENRHKRNEVTVVMAHEAEQWFAKLEPNEHASAIFLVTEKELKGPLPAAVAKMMPKQVNPLKGQISFVQSEMIKPAKHGLAFSVVLYAPDGRRLEWLCEEFVQRGFDNWRQMPFATEFSSDRIALFTQDHMKPTMRWWGDPKTSNVWRDIAWYAIDRRDLVLPEELEFASEVYLVDRSKPAALPPKLSGLVGGVSETTLFASQVTEADGTKRVAFSAPSQLLLENLLARFPNLRRLPETTYHAEAVDLRTLDKALLVVPSSTLDPLATRQIHAELLKPLASGTGQPLHPPFADGKPNEVALQLLVGNSDEAVAFRKSLNLRYAWIYVPGQPGTSMSYRTYESRQTADPGPFTESEPCEPSRDGKTKEEYEKAMEKYRCEHDEWCSRKRNWEYERDNMAVYWIRTLERDTNVSTTGHLRLLDLANQGKTVWQAEVTGSANEYGEVLERDTVIVKGFSHIPGGFSRPSSDNPPDIKLVINANLAAAIQGIEKLQAEAWLPDSALARR